MNSETLQNPYLVRLFCILILTKHISNYNIVKNRLFDKIKIVWALKFKKGGGDRPPVPPKSALAVFINQRWYARERTRGMHA